MQLFTSLIYTSLFCALLPGISSAGVELYTGSMEVVSVSGKACAGLTGTHTVSLILGQDDDGSAVSGYFGGQGITTGRFLGSDRSRLDVRYPYQDEFKAAGHYLSITHGANGLLAELRDRHIDPTVDDCNFDLARMTLSRTADGLAAEARLKPMAALFDAQLMRSQAFGLARAGQYESALPLYEKALALAEPATGGDETLLAPYITGLANAYVKLGHLEAFNRLYDERIGSIRDEGVRGIFTGHRVSSLLKTGKASLAREEYPAALESFRKARLLQPRNREAIAAVMTVHLRTGNFDSAIVFLEGELKNIDIENGGQDLRSALAHVYFLRSNKYEKTGQVAQAEADLKSAEALDSQSVLYVIALARLRHKAGSLAEAEKVLQKGLEHFRNETSRQEIIAARDRLRQTETILKKLRRAGD